MYNNPFRNKNIRALYSPVQDKWWFSAVDICTILTGGTYDYGRKYWSNYKYFWVKKEKQLIVNYDQLKMPAKNGKYYFTEVLDAEGVALLIQVVQHANAMPYKLWLAKHAVAGVGEALKKAGSKFNKKISSMYKTDPQKYASISVERRVLVDMVEPV